MRFSAVVSAILVIFTARVLSSPISPENLSMSSISDLTLANSSVTLNESALVPRGKLKFTGCHYTRKFLWYNYLVWGAGWLETEIAARKFKHDLRAKGLTPMKFVYKQGGGDDHREFSMWFTAVLNSRPNVETLIEKTSKTDVRCDRGKVKFGQY
jgi:hypothetical protein